MIVVNSDEYMLYLEMNMVEEKENLVDSDRNLGQFVYVPANLQQVVV